MQRWWVTGKRQGRRVGGVTMMQDVQQQAGLGDTGGAEALPRCLHLLPQLPCRFQSILAQVPVLAADRNGGAPRGPGGGSRRVRVMVRGTAAEAEGGAGGGVGCWDCGRKSSG